ncbi:hypothetical protein H5410_016342 [Solanum commersonii]|uniref:Uncharacterized protein n=1 Tax=Solanum commersonii TaxID=4109 RepID=A0A9J5ZW47_SOLCO|nr:hypothetical protein H5410_016342 [Solanum commersonii]
MRLSPISQFHPSSAKTTDKTPAPPSLAGITTSEPLSFFSFFMPLLQPPVNTCEAPHRATSIHFLLLFSLVSTKNFDRTTTMKSHLASTNQVNYHPSSEKIDNNDNKRIVSPPLRPARPGRALRFLKAIEVGS